MKNLVKKVLTDKKARNKVALSGLMLSMAVLAPWGN